VYLSGYLDFDDAHRLVQEFTADVYNEKRPPSALGYLPAAGFEAGTAAAERQKGHPGR
jgi:transposase InsO family protein